MTKRILALMTAAVLILVGCAGTGSNNTQTEDSAPPAQETQETQDTASDQPLVILYTNDVHCAVDDFIGYDGLVSYKEQMEQEGNAVLLIDAGDAFQGGIYGTLTKGEAIIHLMNDAGYDLVTPGNHEFDYGMDQFLSLVEEADFPYVCCNFIDLRTGEPVFEPYRILEAGGKRIAFVGACTPTTYTTSTPKYFQDDQGNFIYSFMQDSDGSSLYKTVQDAVDAANAENPDYTILISHLGITETDSPYMSTEVIRNTRGIDVVLDGHSHSVVEMEEVKNADGETVLLTQTGYHMQAIGKLTIDPAGNLKTELIKDYTDKDETMTANIEKEGEEFKEKAEKVIAASDFPLRARTEDNSGWLVRNNETNLADFVTDAYRYVSDAEIGIVNGGGLRSTIDAGEITYEDLVNVHPFSNQLVVLSISGQNLADALEYSVSYAPSDFGGFLQVSGVTFDVDLDKNADVQLDENGMFKSFGSDERRVSNIQVNGEPLNPDRKYNVVSNTYILLNHGNGYSMFNGDIVPMDREVQDIDALAEYLQSMNEQMSSDYSDPAGQERIHFLNN